LHEKGASLDELYEDEGVWNPDKAKEEIEKFQIPKKLKLPKKKL